MSLLLRLIQLDAYEDRPTFTLDVLQRGALGLRQRELGGLASGFVTISRHCHLATRRRLG